MSLAFYDGFIKVQSSFNKQEITSQWLQFLCWIFHYNFMKTVLLAYYKYNILFVFQVNHTRKEVFIVLLKNESQSQDNNHFLFSMVW